MLSKLCGLFNFILLELLTSLTGNASGAVVWTPIYQSGSSAGTTPAVCHPTPNSAARQFLIGYGSLMQEASKKRTAPNTGESVPVEIRGFSRVWNAQGVSISFSTTFLGIVNDPVGRFNAVIFEIPNTGNVEQTIASYDEREAWYCRQRVPSKDVIALAPGTAIDGYADYWIYVNKPEYTNGPNTKYPIVESYVDIFISGCMEVEAKFKLPNFAKACVTSTKGWEAPWVNDRLLPRRAFIYEPNASKIDKVLATGVPAAYNAITIEG